METKTVVSVRNKFFLLQPETTPRSSPCMALIIFYALLKKLELLKMIIR